MQEDGFGEVELVGYGLFLGLGWLGGGGGGGVEVDYCERVAGVAGWSEDVEGCVFEAHGAVWLTRGRMEVRRLLAVGRNMLLMMGGG